MRALGRMRVVRDHDDGLAVFVVERLEQRQDLVAGLAVEGILGVAAARLKEQAATGGTEAVLAKRALERLFVEYSRGGQP